MQFIKPCKSRSSRLVDPEGQHAHVLVPPDHLSLAIGREGQNVRLAARLTGWKIDIKNSQEYDQEAEDSEVAELITQREEEESLQKEAGNILNSIIERGLKDGSVLTTERKKN